MFVKFGGCCEVQYVSEYVKTENAFHPKIPNVNPLWFQLDII